MYTRLIAYNEDRYEELADYAVKKAKNDLILFGLSEDELTMLLLIANESARVNEVREILKEYNSVTQYLYSSEADRKRARLIEAMMTAIATGDMAALRQTERRSASLWYLQSSEYAISVTDRVYLDTLKEAGVSQVRWIAEDDSRTCKVCRERHLKVYDIDKVPDKPHYNCRCVLRPFKVGSGKT